MCVCALFSSFSYFNYFSIVFYYSGVQGAGGRFGAGTSQRRAGTDVFSSSGGTGGSSGAQTGQRTTPDPRGEVAHREGQSRITRTCSATMIGSAQYPEV